MDAFISYRRRDGAPLARYVRRRLLRFRLPREVIARIVRRRATCTRVALHLARHRVRAALRTIFFTHSRFLALDRAERLIVG